MPLVQMRRDLAALDRDEHPCRTPALTAPWGSRGTIPRDDACKAAPFFPLNAVCKQQ